MVAQGGSGEIYIFIIPVAEELDFKKQQRQQGGKKKVEMIHVKDITKYTGYIRGGGCSPIGMKKTYLTFIDEIAVILDSIIISGGKIGGVQIELKPEDLVKITEGGEIIDLVK